MGYTLDRVIKTIRRQAYGFNDDEYFFLRIIDHSRKSHPTQFSKNHCLRFFDISSKE